MTIESVFVMWITFQLVLIALAEHEIRAELDSNTYQCSTIGQPPLFVAGLLPLVYFVPSNSRIVAKCEVKP